MEVKDEKRGSMTLAARVALLTEMEVKGEERSSMTSAARVALLTEMETKAEERAKRYAATVRPAMASARYARDDVGEPRRPQEEGGKAGAEEDEHLRGTEEGELRSRCKETERLRRSEEGVPQPLSGADAQRDQSTSARCETTNIVVEEHSIEAEVRQARKLDRKEAKPRRVQHVIAKRVRYSNEVAAERQRRSDAAKRQAARMQKAVEARAALKDRRDRTVGDRMRCSKASLVQRSHYAGATAEKDAGAVAEQDAGQVRQVEADDGLPTAMMDVAK
ncbi:hypothetical protein PF008_g10513 [Phytophthora fragariae]|uniref:Uncharacterized protein n=1 Tax=Phytophthora fragariae TaxID=53985 RepID=A0A6G0RUF5_9STRA|nr:hypothetical protein PF008_g10513 [Phytophthora fragariae]